MRRNILRELLDDEKPTVSTRMVTVNPEIVEIIGHSGAFHFIELLGEYASWTVADLDNFSRVVELFPYMTSMMKVEREPRLFITQRALGSGIQNILFADCDSADEVRECVSYVRPNTPEAGGLHGSSMRRNVGFLLENGSEAWVKAMNEAVIEVMIESDSALEQLDDILSVEGVDMVHFGPSDYSLSIGKPGAGSSPEVQIKHRYVIETAMKKGIRPRVVIDDYTQAKEYADMGVMDFCVGSDLGTLYRWCLQTGEKMKDILEG